MSFYDESGDCISLADFYYKIEDKWFDLLDWLEAHHVPVYKIVDPLEKRGIPSLPVFVAFLLILIYVLFSLLGGGIGLGGGGGNVQLVDAATGDCITGAHVEFSNSETYAYDMGDTCKEISIPLGDYTLKVSKSNCENLTTDVTIDEGMNNVSLSMNCGTPSDKVNLCFSPKVVGTVNVIVNKDGKFFKKITNCGTNACSFYASSVYTYKFETSKEFASAEEFSAAKLKNYNTENACIRMVGQGSQVTEDTGKVNVEVRNTAGTLLPGLRVKLVNPQDINGVIASQTTGYNGSALGMAYFEEKIGVGFKIKVEASANTSVYVNPTAYNFTREPQDIKIVLNQNASAPTRITVIDKTTNLGIWNVFVNFFEQPSGVNNTYTYTNQQGNATMGLRIGFTYRVTFWKNGYKNFGDTITAGQDKTFYMEQVSEDEVGQIEAAVYFKDDGPVEGAYLTLKKDNEDVGANIPRTGPDGISLIQNVMPGDYCIEVSRDSGAVASKCADNKVTVLAGETTEKQIAIQETKYKLTVTVKMGNGVVNGTSVQVTDNFGGFTLKNTTSVFGRAIFSIPETNGGIEVSAYYKAANGEVFNVVQPMPKIAADTSTTIYLVPSGNKISFSGAKDANGNDIDYSTATFEGGKIYRFVFSLGIFNIQGDKPDKVKLTVQDTTKGYFEFIPESTVGWINVSSSTPAQTMTYTAEGNFPVGSVYQIEIPARVKQVFSGVQYHNFTYNAYWNKGPIEITDPASGTYKTPDFKLQAGYCSKYGNFGVCKYILKGSSQLDPNTYTANMLDQIKIGIDITNEGSSAYSGKIEIDDTKSSVVFSEAGIVKHNSSGDFNLIRYMSYLLEDHKITVNHQGADMVTLAHGDTLKILASSKVVSPPRSQIVPTAGSQNLGDIVFDILGKVAPVVYFDDSVKDSGNVHIYDLTPEIPFKFKENESNLDILKWRIWQGTASLSTMGGSGLSCGNIDLEADEHYSVDHDWDTPDFLVAFDQACRIIAGGELKITLSGTMYDVKPADWTLNTESCLAFPSETEMTANMYASDSCDVEFELSPTEQPRVEQPAGGYCNSTAPVTVHVKTCKSLVPSLDVADFNSNEIDYSPRSIANVGVSGKTITFGYKGTLLPGATDSVQIASKLHASAKVTAQNAVIDNTYTLPKFTFVVQGTEQQQAPTCTAGQLFKAERIQKEGTSANCAPGMFGSFCNIEQALGYIKTHTSDFATMGAVNFQMVGQELEPQDIMIIWEQVFGTGYPVIVADKTYEGTERYVIDSAAVIGKGANTATLERFTTNTEHVFITFSNDVTGQEGLDYIQLDMPYQKTISTVGNKLRTGITIDSTVSSDRTETEGLLQSLIKDSWNIDYTATTGTTHNLRAEICDFSAFPDTQVCTSLKSRIGQDLRISAIYREITSSGTTIHIVGNNTAYLKELINEFDDAIKSPGTSSKLMVETGGKYITIAPADCIPKPSPGGESCGNNKREGAEGCDGTDSTNCPGKCTDSCRCAIPLDLAFLGKGFVDLYAFSDIHDGNDITSSTAKTRLTFSGYNSMEKIKVADILSDKTDNTFDGKAEMILFGDSEDGKSKQIVVLNKNTGTIGVKDGTISWGVERVFTLPSIVKNFAVTDWNGDNKADLAVGTQRTLVNGNIQKRIWIFNNSALLSSGDLDATKIASNSTYWSVDDSLSSIDAINDGGNAYLLLSEFGHDDAFDSGHHAVYKNTTVKFGEVSPPDRVINAEITGECSDVALTGSADGELMACLRQSGLTLGDNNIRIYKIFSSMEQKIDINSNNQNAEKILAGDLNADGSPEFIQGDFAGDSKDGIAAYKYDGTEIFSVSVPDGYRDFSTLDWETSFGPRVA